jgi:outer membrane protein OmpA-like peptidoglycan-associated protein
MTRSLLPTLACLLIASCTTNPDGTQSVNRTAVGAAVGAVAGGVLGNRIDDGNRGRGTAIGAVSGAAVGAGVGYMMDRQEHELREQLQIERVRDDLLKLTLENEVSFDFDSAAVKPAFRPTIDKLASVLTKYDRNLVTIVGHTDSTGGESYNESLSLRRAETVMQELSVRGVPRSRISALGRGESEPRASNANEAGRQLNRRVEILVQPVA